MYPIAVTTRYPSIKEDILPVLLRLESISNPFMCQLLAHARSTALAVPVAATTIVNALDVCVVPHDLPLIAVTRDDTLKPSYYLCCRLITTAHTDDSACRIEPCASSDGFHSPTTPAACSDPKSKSPVHPVT